MNRRITKIEVDFFDSFQVIIHGDDGKEECTIELARMSFVEFHGFLQMKTRTITELIDDMTKGFAGELPVEDILLRNILFDEIGEGNETTTFLRVVGNATNDVD